MSGGVPPVLAVKTRHSSTLCLIKAFAFLYPEDCFLLFNILISRALLVFRETLLLNCSPGSFLSLLAKLYSLKHLWLLFWGVLGSLGCGQNFSLYNVVCLVNM